MKLKYILFVFLLLSVATFAKSKKKIKPIKIYITQLPPWVKVKNGQCDGGIICDFFKVMQKMGNLNLKYETLSLARTNIAFYEGRQGMALFPKNMELAKKYHILGKVVDYDLGVLVAKGVKVPKSLSKEVLCITRKNPHMSKEYKYIEVNKLEQCMRMMKKKRVDYVQLSDLELRDIIGREKDLSMKDFSHFKKMKKLSLWFYLNKRYNKSSKTYQHVVNTFKGFNQKTFQKKYTLDK